MRETIPVITKSQGDLGASAQAQGETIEGIYDRHALQVERWVRRLAGPQVDRRDEALRALDALEFARVPGGAERLLQRAELRVWAGRQQEAITDFDGVIARVGDGTLAERALWGRAQAKPANGDSTGAQRDAVLYLQRHPTGRFARPAAHLAGRAP